MIGINEIYLLLGALFAVIAVRVLRDASHPRRWPAGLFWSLLTVAFVVGDRLPPALMGVIAIALAVLAGGIGLGRRSGATATVVERETRSVALGHRLFVPALALPVLTLAAVFGFAEMQWNGEPVVVAAPAQYALVCLAFACLIALALAFALTRAAPVTAVAGSQDLLETIGWPFLLPLLLACLGAVFAKAGIGEWIAVGVRGALPVDVRAVAVVAYAFGMLLFTVVMGNAFAAFPVMTAGIGLPILVVQHGADPAALAAIGMLSGYCGTLLTPMAANFNIVPAALLELRDPYAVIKAQWPTALLLWAGNVVVMLIVLF